MTTTMAPIEYGVVEIEENIFITRKGSRVYLKLPSETTQRLLGMINIKDSTFEVYRKKAHIFQKFEGVGFCYGLLSKATLFDKIRLVIEDNGCYVIPIKFILNREGNFLYFKKQGFEKQVFIKIEDIQQFKTTHGRVC